MLSQHALCDRGQPVTTMHLTVVDAARRSSTSPPASARRTTPRRPGTYFVTMQYPSPSPGVRSLRARDLRPLRHHRGLGELRRRRHRDPRADHVVRRLADRDDGAAISHGCIRLHDADLAQLSMIPRRHAHRHRRLTDPTAGPPSHPFGVEVRPGPGEGRHRLGHARADQPLPAVHHARPRLGRDGDTRVAWPPAPAPRCPGAGCRTAPPGDRAAAGPPGPRRPARAAGRRVPPGPRRTPGPGCGPTRGEEGIACRLPRPRRGPAPRRRTSPRWTRSRRAAPGPRRAPPRSTPNPSRPPHESPLTTTCAGSTPPASSPR